MKKFNKIFLFILLFLISLTLTGCFFNKQEAKKEEKNSQEKFINEYGEYNPKIWKIENDQGNIIYLFGSIHVGVENMYPLPTKITNAFNECEVLAVESDVIALEENTELLTEMSMIMVNDDFKFTKDILSSKQMEALDELGKKYLYPITEYDFFKPLVYQDLFTELFIKKTKYNTDFGVDMYFLKEAKKKNMEIKEIEDPIETMKTIYGLPIEKQLILFDIFIEEFQDEEVLNTDLDDMFKAWVNGKIKEFLNKEDEKKYTKQQEDAMDEYDKRILAKRNINMTNKIIEYLNSNIKHFYVVGAAHFEGEDNIIELLKAKGYQVFEL